MNFCLLSVAFIYFHLLLFTFTCVFCVFLKKEKCAGTPNYYTTRYQFFSEEENDKKCQYARERYINLPEEEKEK